MKIMSVECIYSLQDWPKHPSLYSSLVEEFRIYNEREVPPKVLAAVHTLQLAYKLES